jgi:hypothetical protein
MWSLRRRIRLSGQEVDMRTPPRAQDHPWVTASAIVLLALHGTPGGAARSGDAWDACQDRAIADLEAAGGRKFGDPSAYTGATGSGALDAVIAQCGYRPEPVDATLCDELYRQVYRACREDGFEGMSMAATSWVLVFDPDGPLVQRLRRVCTQTAPVSRDAFGRLVCGK